MKVDIDEFRRKLEDYIDPYEIPGAMQAFVEASEGTESFEIWKETKWIPWNKCKWIRKEEKHDDTEVSCD